MFRNEIIPTPEPVISKRVDIAVARLYNGHRDLFHGTSGSLSSNPA